MIAELAQSPKVKHPGACAADIGMPCRLCQLANERPELMRFLPLLPPEPAGKPGAELKALTDAMGIPFCEKCKARASTMDNWGVAGCRENLETIHTWVRDAARAASWRVTAKAAVAVAKMGLIINPLDPAPGLVAEAIRRAEAKDRKQARKLEAGISVNMGAAGLGDALLGACAVYGLHLANPDATITYKTSPIAHPFLNLLDLGQVRISVHDWDQTRVNPPNMKPGDLQMNDGYHRCELVGPCTVPRIERYCRNIGCMTPVKPMLRDAGALWQDTARYSGAVVLSPFGAWRHREWPIERWQVLETLLTDKGYRVLIVDDARTDRHTLLKSEKVLGASALVVAGILLGAKAFIGNDSGLAHLAGLCDTPSVVVLSGNVSGQHIYDFYGHPARYAFNPWLPAINAQEVMDAMRELLAP